MDQVLLTDELLTRAVGCAFEKWIRAFPEPEACRHIFPEDFYEKTFRRASRQEAWAKAGRRIAAAVLVFLIGGAILLVVNPTARAAIRDWFFEIIGEHVVYQFEENANMTKLPQYQLSYLPDGFEVLDKIDNSIMQSILYRNEISNEVFRFEYSFFHEGMHLDLFTGKSTTQETVTVNGITADFYYADASSNTNNLIWIDKKMQIIFSISGNLDQSIMLHIAENIVLEVPTK